MVLQALFIILTAAAVYLFSKNVSKIRRNILLGRDLDRSDNPSERWMTMLKVAFGQTKMAARPVPFIFHLLIYAGFIIINIEVLEIIIDGVFGTHRVFAPFLGSMYDFLIGSFEFLALGVWLACVVFLARKMS